MTRSRRGRPAVSFRADESGAFQVMEAILAAMILMGAILFVTVTSSPVRDTGAPGIHLGDIAGDTLHVLEQQPGVDEPGMTRLEELVELALTGDTSEAERFLDRVVPAGTRYALRLDNGVEPLQLVPAAGGTLSTPRDASAAATFILGNWSGSGSTADCTISAVCFAPGSDVALDGNTTFAFGANSTLGGPDGQTVGPGGEEWIDIWMGEVPSGDAVPASAPYGSWSCSGGDCSVASFRVVLPDGTATDRPVYAVQLLLWDGV